ncbi:MAG: NYN domain-containing protein [Pseudomonadota bacterium]
MIFHDSERVALFLDGANLYQSARSLGFDIDYGALRKYFADQTRLVRALYYTAIAEDSEFSSIRPLVDWLDYNGYTMVTKPAKEFTDAAGRRRIKGDMDVELAVDVLRMAQYLDHIVILSGDGDFRYLVQEVQQMGKRVTVVSTMKPKPPMIADELRRQADHFIDLYDLRDTVGRPSSRPPRRTLEDGSDGGADADDDAEYAYDEDDDDIDRMRDI